MMSTQVHICGDAYWDGAESRALLCAATAPDCSVIVCGGDRTVVNRMERAGVRVMQAKFSGMFAALNLSRILRHLPEGHCELYVHSPEVRGVLVQALSLSGRHDLTLCDRVEVPLLPPRAVTPPSAGQSPVLMWLGRITGRSGLEALIEALGRLADAEWTLRVVGEGESQTVMPMVRRTRALGIDSRVQWTGYVDDVYARMDCVSLGIITRPDPAAGMAAREFAAAGIPTVGGTDAETLYQLLRTRL